MAYTHVSLTSQAVSLAYNRGTAWTSKHAQRLSYSGILEGLLLDGES